MSPRSSAMAMSRPLCSLLALFAAGAWAQGFSGGMGSGIGLSYDNPSGNLHSSGSSGVGGGSPAGSGGRAFYVVPTLSVGTTLTNNVNLSPTDKQSDFILDILPGIQIGGQSGRVRGYLDYTLGASLYAREQDSSNFRNYLRASANAELVPSWLFVDASASISQQFISPFGTQSTDSGLNNSNRTEVTTVSVAPYMQGQIAGQVNYVGRAFYSATNTGSSQVSNSTVWGALLGFDSTTRWSRLGWGLDFSYREAQFTDRRSEFDQLNVLSLNYAVVPELQLSLRSNVETSNLTTVDSETTTGWGGGLRWNPSPRTIFNAQYDQRVFGNSHLLSLLYRTPRTVWTISNRQGLSTGQSVLGQANGASAYDLLFAQFAGIEPDPVARAQLVNDFMRANGIDSSGSVSGSYLPNQVVVERRQEASVAWRGLRDTLIFNVYQTQSESPQPPLLNPDDAFSGGNVLKWRGVRVNWAHRLHPLSTLSLSILGQTTTETVGVQETTLWTTTLSLSRQLAERASASLTARYSSQTGSSSYNEAALLALLNMSF